MHSNRDIILQMISIMKFFPPTGLLDLKKQNVHSIAKKKKSHSGTHIASEVNKPLL